MTKRSAGILLFKYDSDKLKLFLVHPGGPFYARKDAGVWTIPKGEFADDEEPLNAARREFEEETGLDLKGPFIALTPFGQKSGKQVSAWATEDDINAESLKSNTFELEWPPRSGKMTSFPEIDKGGWFTETEALDKILPAQQVIICELIELLKLRV